MVRMEVDLEQTKKKNKKIEKLLFLFCERELLILGGEILKWTIKKRGEEDGEGLHIFDPAVQSTVLVSLVL